MRHLGTRKILTLAIAAAIGVAMTASPASAGSTHAIDHATHSCGGAVVQTPQPGTEMSAAALGLPASDNAFYANAAAHHVTWLSTLDCTRTGRTHPLGTSSAKPASTPKSAGIQSINWSGYQINRTTQYVQAGWTVPAVVRPKPSYSTDGTYASSIWSGIGGGTSAGSGALIQAGTEQDLSATNVTTDYFWYEIVGGTGDTGSEVVINNFPVHTGDVVGSVSLYTPAGGSQLGDCNFTAGVCMSVVLPTSAPGITAEWIVEGPELDGFFEYTPNFGTVTFVNACWTATYVVGGSCGTIASGNPTSIYIQRFVIGAYQVLASTGPINAAGNGFTDVYDQPVRCPNC